MSLAQQSLQDDLQYTAWANAMVLSACADLPLEELGRDLGPSHRNLINTLFHIYDSERFWLNCLRSHALPALDKPGANQPPATTPAETLAMLQQQWPKLGAEFLAWYSALTSDELSLELASQPPTGHLRMPRWQLLRHSVNHSTLHRGQVIGMLRMLGHQPPQTDMMSFLFTR